MTDDRNAGTPWGPLSTVALGVVVMFVYVGIASTVAAGYVAVAVANDPGLDVERYVSALESDGSFVAASVLLGSFVCTGLVLIVVSARRGLDPRDYLGVAAIPGRSLAQWMLIAVAFAAIWDLTNLVLGRPVVPDFMLDAFRTATEPALLLLAVVVAAPVFEELLFRGFLYTGLARSAIGPAGAIVATALVWAGVHVQYGLYDVAWIFLLGLLLGYARRRSRSIATPIVMHALLNLAASVETWFVLSRAAAP